jgi:hypothetical protein
MGMKYAMSDPRPTMEIASSERPHTRTRPQAAISWEEDTIENSVKKIKM